MDALTAEARWRAAPDAGFLGFGALSLDSEGIISVAATDVVAMGALDR
eukprot:SAG31_NODE_404_length_16109_cov_10.686696_2_plen_48_part_00